MFKDVLKFSLISLAAISLASCEKEQSFVSVDNDALRVKVNTLSPEMQKVRDYVPPMAVAGHRGTIYWAPEETEASWRWAREEGVDYLESDLQVSKDGVIIANHDDNLCRTTDVETVFGEEVPKTRKQFYINHGCTEAEAEELYKNDRLSFEPYYLKSYMYEELLMLDAGKYFNEESEERAMDIFVDNKMYVSTLEDQIKYAEGYRLKRDTEGKRIFTSTGKWDAENPLDCIKYTFEYEIDPADTGNRPGIYIEFKESWLQPKDMVDRVYNELDRLGWNIITKKEADSEPFYKNGKINVGKTNGKVILQTFSLSALENVYKVFQGKVPMCFLLWTGNPPYATDLGVVTPNGYADFINMAMERGCHIMGPSIAGAPNKYPELTAPWMAYLVRKSGMLNHPYSFDSYAQMGKYLGVFDFNREGNDNRNEFSDILQFKGWDNATHYGVRLDGLFTNRAELTISYMYDRGFRNPEAPKPLKEQPRDVIRRLYAK